MDAVIPRPEVVSMRTLAAVAALVLLSTAPGLADDAAVREARWKDVSAEIFDGRPIADAGSSVSVDAPARAEDAATVPVTLRTDGIGVKAMHFVIDGNPAPYAAKVEFGPAGDPREISLRVRVDGYTDVHAVAETAEGRLVASSAFLKASGGCSAPVGASGEEAMKGMGEMRMRFAKDGAATLMVRHPNFSGMQMDQVTRNYTPARFLKEIRVTVGDRLVFALEGAISMSTNPVIGFGWDRKSVGDFRVEAVDTAGGRWEQSFPAPVSG